MAATAESIILHQYDLSPFSEKVRVMLGIKGAEWFSCTQPVIMPKPELTALTGGYRRIPVLQIGADIYCDTGIIGRELERRVAGPTLFPEGDSGLGYALASWSDKIVFNAVVVVLFGSGFRVDDAFVKDREKLSGKFDLEAMKRAVPHMTVQLRAAWDLLETQLSDDRPFLTGDKPGLIDASVYHNLAFLRRGPGSSTASLDGFARLVAWEERVKALGHGRKLGEVSREETLTIARGAQSTADGFVDPRDPLGLKAGDRVRVAADDYGREPIDGELVQLGANRVAIRRHDDRAGDVTVHFPRHGFVVTPAPSA